MPGLPSSMASRQAALERRAGELGSQIAGTQADDLVERLGDELQGRAVGVDAAVLPVQGDEGLVDLLEQTAHARSRSGRGRPACARARPDRSPASGPAARAAVRRDMRT